MKFKYWSLLASVGFAALLYGASPALAQTAPSLGTAQNFAVLGGSTVTNTGATIVAGDLGVSSGSSIVGFPPGIVTGTQHANDAVAMQAQNDVTIAFNTLSQPCNTDLTGQDLGGLTLTSGVYCFNSSAQLTGALTLNGQGNPNAVFIFRMGSTLTTASNSSVRLINGAQACNVFWQVGSSATLGTTTAFVGNILALASITLNTGSSLSGRALSRTGAVTLDTNAVSAPFCIITAAPTLGKAFSPTTINPGGVSTLTITLINSNSNAATLTAPLTDTLPAGVVIAAVPTAANTCGGVVTALAGGNMVTLTGGAIPAGAPGTCTVTVNVTAALGGSYINTLPANALQTSNGNNAAPAIATLTVVSPGTVQLSKAFNSATINAGGVSTLTITLINSNGLAATLTAPLTDTLPAGVVIAAVPTAANTCGGAVTALAGENTVTLTGGAIPAGAPGTCTVTVNVTAALGGSYINTLPANALRTGNGNNAAPAIATLTVVPPPPSTPVNDNQPGSVLIFNLYTSNPADLNRQNTRINLTNTGAQSVAVHLFFIEGSTCSPADAFVCLTPNQTISFLASDFDPGTTGYIVAVASDPITGCPINFNFLIGDEFVKLSSGHAANLAAESFAALTATPPMCSAGVATLNFDGVSYNLVPRVLAVDNFPSPADGNNTLLILNRVGGDLRSGASTIGSLFGVLYDEAEQPLSFTLSSNTCQFRVPLTNSSLRTTPPLETVISAGRTGWLRLWGVNDIGLLGAVINFNASAGVNNFSQGHNLHKLTLTSASLTIPVFPPSC